MLKHLQLDRPLTFFDIETTGVDPRSDRIVELAFLRLEPGCEPDEFVQRFNPGIPIPAPATAVHGITDGDVAEMPSFDTIAEPLAEYLADSDWAGFNLKRFDVPFLVAECARAGVELMVSGRSIVDVLQLYHARAPRDLAAAVRCYCGREHEGAHGALADARASAAVLDAQLARYLDLPRDVAALHRSTTEVDVAGRFRLQGGRVVFGFGKYRGCPLDRVAGSDPDYLRWVLSQDFLDDVRSLVERALGTAWTRGNRCG